MSQWPDAANPREVRAFAHTQIDRLRQRQISYRVAQQAVEQATKTSRGSRAGLTGALARAASYTAVAGVGSQYNSATWPVGPEKTAGEKAHLVFKNVPGLEDEAREFVRSGTEHSWEVIRDELVARGRHIYDAGYGGGAESVVAVVLDQDISTEVCIDLFKQYGLMAQTDTIHQTSFA